MAGDQWLGAELAGYRIDALVGRGGAGVVYRATHLRLGRQAAVKLLSGALAADVEYQRRFEREARLAASLQHPYIVPIYDAGHAQDVLYLAMGYIDGPNLATVIDTDAPMDLHRVCALLGGVAEALDSAHATGLVHRDIKPANILIAPPQPSELQRAYLCDFGIARHASATTSSALTSTGQFLGTLQYCAPEQIQNHPLDGRTDQYALACVAYHCLTGRVPYPADEPAAVMFAHVSADPPRPSTHVHGLPTAVDDILAQALAKQPDHRYPNCATLLHALATASNNTAATDITAVAAPQPAPTPVPASPHTLIWPPEPAHRRTTTSPPLGHDRDHPQRSHGSRAVLWVLLALLMAVSIPLVVTMAASPSLPTGDDVQYQVDGSGSEADVIYVDSGKFENKHVHLPFRTNASPDPDKPSDQTYFQIDAQGDHNISCQIVNKSRVLHKDAPLTGYASCYYKPAHP